MALKNREMDLIADDDAYALRDGELEYGDVGAEDEEEDDGIDIKKLGRVMREKTEAARKVRVDVDLSASAPKLAGEQWLQMRSVREDGGTQSRVRLDPIIVQDYADQFTHNGTITATRNVPSFELWWGDFPAVDAYLDGDYWLVDGFHRLAGIDQALMRAGLDEHSRGNWLVRCRVFLGSKREAVLYAAGANARHGLRRTNADKRKAVETLLRDDEWRQWSDAEIARRCKVDGKTVGNVRKLLESTLDIPESLVRKSADGRTMDTTKVGARPEPVERLRQPAPAPTPTPAKAVYVEPEAKAIEKPELNARNYLPDSERVEIEDPDLRAAGFHLIRTKYGPDGWLWRYWWTNGDDADCGPQRGTMESAIADARQGLAKLQPPLAPVADPSPEISAAPLEPQAPTTPADLAEAGFSFVRVGKGMWAIESDEEGDRYQSNWCFEPTDCIANARSYLASFGPNGVRKEMAEPTTPAQTAPVAEPLRSGLVEVLATDTSIILLERAIDDATVVELDAAIEQLTGKRGAVAAERKLLLYLVRRVKVGQIIDPPTEAIRTLVNMCERSPKPGSVEAAAQVRTWLEQVTA